MLVSFALGDTIFSHHLTQNPQRNSVEYRLHRQNTCVGDVHFIFFVSISFALGSQFPVEYGL